MIREIEMDDDGEEIVILTPQDETDLKVIDAMAAQGKIDTNESFSDYKNKK